MEIKDYFATMFQSFKKYKFKKKTNFNFCAISVSVKD